MRKTYLQVNQYYPKGIYDQSARKEMNSLLLAFNDSYYGFFPYLVSKEEQVVVDYYPKSHSKQYEVNRIMELCKIQKVRRKDMMKIEEFLNLKYIIETQLDFYNWNLKNVQKAKEALANESFESFFPVLFEERKYALQDMRFHYKQTIEKLQSENQQCEQRIEELLHRGPGFLGETSQLIGEVMTESIRKVRKTFNREP